ncbi:MAG TPA: DegT/DnrJ/EryC1/StrS family aminotransferase [Candidatus Krumholzibacteria bacterium]|nr:DegT/DnrJ/EryC1/StrS family aminotransferase [Candidatus Krumholzibacteria bacterium]HPD72606.1 DegT/DnrJ/EryC1/StrS family aminotransferase [Candidatus Krumholzibacteria bacterium]HRY40462.1 DegT/DnrJ/EryC1/StrS family aminotransferase [Candidatus Krumholzibacteria bacterium]
MRVAFVDLKAQYASIKPEIDQALAEVIADCAFIGGKYAARFEQEFAAYLGREHCVGVANGTDALYTAMKGLGLGPGDEVITAANTFIATAEGITATGAEVVFVDNDPLYYNLDPAGIEAAITPRTRAIVPVHLYGQPCAMDRILEIAAAHDLIVIEDAAQAHGALWRGKRAGTFGRCACFSFYPGKNLGAYGDAGGVVTDDSALAEFIRSFANHGRHDTLVHSREGVNSRLDGFQAAVLSVKLRHLEAWTAARIAAAARYTEALAGVCVPPAVHPEARHVFHLYVIRVANRDAVRKHLQAAGVPTGIHYQKALPYLAAFERLGHAPADFPHAFRFQDEILSLPMHGDLTADQIDFVADTVRGVARPPEA